jgi:hypothetical protein
VPVNLNTKRPAPNQKRASRRPACRTHSRQRDGRVLSTCTSDRHIHKHSQLGVHWRRHGSIGVQKCQGRNSRFGQERRPGTHTRVQQQGHCHRPRECVKRQQFKNICGRCGSIGRNGEGNPLYTSPQMEVVCRLHERPPKWPTQTAGFTWRRWIIGRRRTAMVVRCVSNLQQKQKKNV